MGRGEVNEASVGRQLGQEDDIVQFSLVLLG